MMTVKHYPLPHIGRNMVAMPDGAEVLNAVEENLNIAIRAMIDTEKQDAWRTFDVAITGPLSDDQAWRRFIDKVQIRSVTFYVFEVKQ